MGVSLRMHKQFKRTSLARTLREQNIRKMPDNTTGTHCFAPSVLPGSSHMLAKNIARSDLATIPGR